MLARVSCLLIDLFLGVMVRTLPFYLQDKSDVW